MEHNWCCVRKNSFMSKLCVNEKNIIHINLKILKIYIFIYYIINCTKLNFINNLIIFKLLIYTRNLFIPFKR